MDSQEQNELLDDLVVDDALVDRFVSSEAFRRRLVGALLAAGRWGDLSRLLGALRETGVPFWVDFFCAAVDDQASENDYEWLLGVLDENQVYDYPVLLQLHEHRPGDYDLEIAYDLALRFVGTKIAPAAYYYRMSLLADALRLGVSIGPVIDMLDVDSVEYMVGRLAEKDPGRFVDLRDALEAWQLHPRAEAGEMERYLALRASELVFYRCKDEYRSDPDGTVERYRRAMERRFQWELEHRAPGMCENGGSVALPATVRAVCHMHKAFMEAEAGNALGALVELRSAVLLDLGLGEVAFVLGGRFESMLQNQLETGEVVDEEYEETLNSVKQKIEMMIQAGFGAEVVGMIGELERMIPGDGDVRRLKVLAGLMPPS